MLLLPVLLLSASFTARSYLRAELLTNFVPQRLFALVDLLGLSNEKVPYTYIAGNEPSMYNFAATTPPSVQ